MSEQHTPGLLIPHDPTYALHAIRCEKGRIVADVGYSGTKERDITNARRLAACWNACDLMPTEDVERLADIGQGVMNLVVTAADLKAERDQARTQRDQLLDALKALLSEHAVPSSGCKDRPAYEQARAAIAACEPTPVVVHLPVDDTEGGAV
jgi:hypothetical protein